MSRRTSSGIHNILDGIISPQNPLPVASPDKPNTCNAAIPTQDIKKQKPSPPSGARRGRPLGNPATPTQPKTKVTLWLSREIAAAYRDWSWEARTQFSHLVEKALVSYQLTSRNPKNTSR